MHDLTTEAAECRTRILSVGPHVAVATPVAFGVGAKGRKSRAAVSPSGWHGAVREHRFKIGTASGRFDAVAVLPARVALVDAVARTVVVDGKNTAHWGEVWEMIVVLVLVPRLRPRPALLLLHHRSVAKCVADLVGAVRQAGALVRGASVDAAREREHINKIVQCVADRRLTATANNGIVAQPEDLAAPHLLHVRPGLARAAVEASLVEDEVKAVVSIVGRVLVWGRVWTAVILGGV